MRNPKATKEMGITGVMDFDRLARSRPVVRAPTKNELLVLKFLLNGPKNLYQISYSPYSSSSREDTGLRFSTVHLIVNRLVKAGLLETYECRKFERTGKITREYGLTYMGLFVLLRNSSPSDWSGILDKITENYPKFYEDLPLNHILSKWKLFKENGLSHIYLAAFYEILMDIFGFPIIRGYQRKIGRLLKDKVEEFLIKKFFEDRMVSWTEPLPLILSELIGERYADLPAYFIRHFIRGCIGVIMRYRPKQARIKDLEKLFKLASLDEGLERAFLGYLTAEKAYLNDKLEENKTLEELAKKFFTSL